MAIKTPTTQEGKKIVISKNTRCADAIANCVDIILSETATSKQIKTATVALKTILKYAMPYVRKEEQAVLTLKEQFKKLNSIKKKLPSLPSDIFVNALLEECDILPEKAHAIVIPAFVRGLADFITQQKREIEQDFFETNDEPEENLEEYEDTTIMEDIAELRVVQESDDINVEEDQALNVLVASKILRKRLKKLIEIVCKNETSIALSKQLFFINDVLKTEPPKFIGDEKCQNIIDKIIAQSGNKFFLERDLIEEIIYRIFHRVRITNIVEYLNNKPSTKNQSILTELTENYDISDRSLFIEDPFQTQKNERAEFVKGLQKYTLEALILTKKFLKKKGLTFYLTEGTLLGAIRHKGFIPWDDDVDIAMPRKDYRKLVKLAKAGKIPPELHFDSLETNSKHWVLGAKMQLVKQTPYIQHKVTELSECNGPYVDIFPLDCWSSPFSYKQRRADQCVKLARRMLFMKTGYSTATKHKKHRILLKFILPFIKNTWIEKFAIKNMTKFYRKNPKYYVNLCSYYPFYKEVFPASFFGEPKYVKFEGVSMPVPCEYDYMLKTIYGKSYDTIPPVRVTNMRKHAFDIREDFEETK